MQFWFHVANIALIVAILGVSLNLLVGVTGLVSLAHGALFGVAAYATAVASVDLGVPFPATIAVSVLVTAAVATLTAWPALRVRGEYLILLTLAVQEMLVQVFESWRSVTGGTSGFGGIFRPLVAGRVLTEPADYLPLIAVVTAICAAVGIWVSRSPFGRTLRAVREEPTATLAIGRSVTAHKVSSFAIAGALAGVAGALFAHYQVYLSPGVFTLDQSIFLMSVVVLGGAGNMLGAVLGAVSLSALPEVLRFLEVGEGTVGVVQKLVYGLLLVGFMIFRPQGLIPERLGRPWRYKGVRHEQAERPDVVADQGAERGTALSLAATGEAAPQAGGAPPPPDGARPVVPFGQDGASRQGAARHDGEPELADRGGSLVAAGLRKHFGGVIAADGLDLRLEPGRVTALVGPNGAGKTTVFNLLTGFIPPDAGTVRLDGEPLDGLAPWRRAQRGLTRTFQDVRLFGGLSVYDNVAVAVPDQPGQRPAPLLTRPDKVVRGERETAGRVAEALAFVGMEGRAAERAADLSFGEQKLVSMARALATRPEVLLLDEPMSGVDRAWVDRTLAVIDRLAQQGMTICLVEHNLDVVRAVSTHAYFMDAGKIIAEGSPAELMADPALADLYFGRVP